MLKANHTLQTGAQYVFYMNEKRLADVVIWLRQKDRCRGNIG